MGTTNRRDAVKRTVALAVVGAGGFASGRALGQEAKRAAGGAAAPVPAGPPRLSRHSDLPSVPGDPMLERAAECPFHFMFAREAVFEVGADAAGHEVIFSPARGAWRDAGEVGLRHSSMVVFRVDAGRDDFTRQGGIYWRCHKSEGKLQLKTKSAEPDWLSGEDGQKRGPLVLAVRDRAGTVRCYLLTLDMRC